jgi:translation initiation factor eIF-2B subunit beta
VDQPTRPSLTSSHTSHGPGGAPLVQSLFSIFSTPEARSPSSTPTGHVTPIGRASLSVSNLASLGDFAKDIKAEVCEGIREMLDELDQVDEQIAAYALDQIHANEIILTHTSSTTVQKFLLTAAKKRKFTVIHAESFPNDHEDTRTVVFHGRKRESEEEAEGEDRFKTLTSAGLTVVVIPDSAVFAIMSRVNKVILATHSVLANGALVAAAGARNIAMAAKMHETPVVVLSGVYKLSPIYPFNAEELIEYGDSGKAATFDDGEFVDAVEVVNPTFDYVPADLVDLYVTNL